MNVNMLLLDLLIMNVIAAGSLLNFYIHSMWLDFFLFLLQIYCYCSSPEGIIQKEDLVFPEWTLWTFTVLILSVLIFWFSNPLSVPLYNCFCLCNGWHKEDTHVATGTTNPSVEWEEFTFGFVCLWSVPFMPALALVCRLTGITGCTTSISPASQEG